MWQLDQGFQVFRRRSITGLHGLDQVLSDAKTFLQFLAEAGYLDSASDDLTKLITRLDRTRPDFQARMADSRRIQPGQEDVARYGSRGITPGQTDAVQTWIERFNARPKSEREALLGTLPGSRHLDRPSHATGGGLLFDGKPTLLNCGRRTA
jgi:hypothetical protein